MPIFNHRDYRTARSRLAQLEAVLGPEGVIDSLTSNLSPEISAARRQTLSAELAKLRNDIEAYETLQSKGDLPNETASGDLGLLPIIGRVARRLSQRELAELLEISEQQIQRYESDRYAGISLSRYQRLLNILGVEMRARLDPTWSASTEIEAPTAPSMEVDPALLAELRKRKWVALPRGVSTDDAGKILTAYVLEGEEFGRGRALHRRGNGGDADAGLSSLAIWRSRVLRQASLQRPHLRTKFNLVDTSWVMNLARLSARADGPLQAVELLREQGIIFVVVPHLPHTRLDGAAMLMADGCPVVALTLRYDRLDSFWFTLFHEIGHVLLHSNYGLENGFVDDLDELGENVQEKEADSFALSAFIPDEIWQTSPVRFSGSAELVKKFADSLNIHASVVAGRIRRDRGDYTIFNSLLGKGSVRKLFADQFA